MASTSPSALSATSLPILTADSLQIGRVLGRGEHGEVRLARFVPSLELAAIKVVDLRRGQRMFDRELEAFRRAHGRSQRIVGCHGWLTEGQIGYLVLEYLPWPTLERLIADHGPLPERLALHLFLQLAEGVAALHGVGVAHRDLKSANILVRPDGLEAKILDFGLSARVDEVQAAYLSQYRWQEFVGTPSNMTPEQLHREPYSASSSDVWALGIVLLEMLLGRHPYKDARSEAELIHLQQCASEHHAAFSFPVRMLLTGLLARDPARRLSLVTAHNYVWQLLAHGDSVSAPFTAAPPSTLSPPTSPLASLQLNNPFGPTPPTTPTADQSRDQPFLVSSPLPTQGSSVPVPTTSVTAYSASSLCVRVR